jgi:hypothetical protein
LREIDNTVTRDRQIERLAQIRRLGDTGRVNATLAALTEAAQARAICWH